MKVLLVLSAVLAAAVAKPGYLGAAHGVIAAPALAYGALHGGYAAYGPAHVAVGPGGYLLDTPEVAATKAAHLTAVAQTRVRDAHVNGAHALAYAAPAAYAAHGAAVLAAPALGYGHGLAYGHGLGYGLGYGYGLHG